VSNPIFDPENLMDQAEREHALNGISELILPVRRRPGMPDFYEKLEEALREQDLLEIAEYRMVKEGFVRLSRPSKLKLPLAALVKHRPHLPALFREISFWRRDFPDLAVEAALRQFYRELTADPALTRSCFEVLAYLLRYKDKLRGLLPRQVPHSESTKLIGRESLLLRLFNAWRGEAGSWEHFFRFFELLERPVEFRFYAPVCRFDSAELNGFHGILTEDSATRFRFMGNAGTLIVENLETFHAEAALSRDRLVIWGCGWKVLLLRRLCGEWPRPIIYWGDIDKEGYEIYGKLKEQIPDLKSTLMDRKTIESHIHASIAKPPFFGPFRSAADLQSEYQYVSEHGLCIEQEKIHHRPY
jgi:hypothetical protein